MEALLAPVLAAVMEHLVAQAIGAAAGAIPGNMGELVKLFLASDTGKALTAKAESGLAEGGQALLGDLEALIQKKLGEAQAAILAKLHAPPAAPSAQAPAAPSAQAPAAPASAPHDPGVLHLTATQVLRLAALAPDHLSALIGP
jgi:hypothetical protein